MDENEKPVHKDVEGTKIRAKRRSSQFIPPVVINAVRKAVSGSRSRLKDGTIYLDLTYITKRIVAMGLPSTGFESIYRNSLEDVSDYLTEKHGKNYKVWNLSERFYNFEKLNIVQWCSGWKDHTAPPISIIFTLVEQMKQWFDENENNVAVVHCKAGKGRTGTIICAHLLSEGLFHEVPDVMEFFVSKRSSKNKKHDGVTIPSQIRYLGYFNTLIKKFGTRERIFNDFDFLKPLFILYLTIRNPGEKLRKKYSDRNMTLLIYRSFQDGKKKTAIKFTLLKKVKPNQVVQNDWIKYDIQRLRCCGDIMIIGKTGGKETFRVQFHTSFHQYQKKIMFKQHQIDEIVKKKNLSDLTMEIGIDSLSSAEEQEEVMTL